MDEEIKGVLVELKQQDNIYVVTADQIINKDFGPELWVVDKLIPEQSITAITGVPGSYKTWLTLEIAKCVAQGSNFLGQFKTNRGNVLFLDKENHLRHIQKRLNLLGIQNLPIFYFSRAEDFLIDKEKDYKSLVKVIDNLGIDLVIFDSLVRIHSGDENSSKDIAKVMNAFRKITNKGVTVIFIHHNRKEGTRTQSTTNSIRGSSDIFAGIDCLLQISKTQDEKSIGISQAKLRQDEAINPFKIKICSSKEKNSMAFNFSGDFDSDESEIEEAKLSIVEILKDNNEKSKQELTDILLENYTPNIINKTLKTLEVLGIIVKHTGAHNKHSFCLKEGGVITRVDENN
ncbi:MAG: AAA family ATPase [Candidatus Paceibacterota bacterium]